VLYIAWKPELDWQVPVVMACDIIWPVTDLWLDCLRMRRYFI